MANIEPFSYFRPRGVHESTNSVWQEGGNWIRSKAKIVVDATGAVIEKGKTTAAYVASSYDVAADKVYENGTRWVQRRLKGDFEEWG